MGNDWGGRRKLNPDNAARVTRQQVLKYAADHRIEVKRDGLGSGMWFFKRGPVWCTLGQTNYIALRWMQKEIVEACKFCREGFPLAMAISGELHHSVNGHLRVCRRERKP